MSFIVSFADHLVMSLTASTVARHTLSNLIRECRHKEDKINSLQRKISSLEEGDGVRGQEERLTTPNQGWIKYRRDQSTPLIPPPSLSGSRLRLDHSSMVARLELEKKHLQEELSAR